ncbi:MAG TPA: GNAT family N-acetyltransferase [Candidatus Acidoferrales bacterium]|nr:GNAT family N-acetyltransferase [Candidatus Acidoferrales bacterium]
MQIVDLRQVHSRTLEPLFREEANFWQEELHWDYRSSIDLIRKFIDARSLGGYLALESGQPAGYGFYVLEDHKGLIGGLFVSSQYSHAQITQKLLIEMLTALRATPHLARIEAQLMPFGAQLDPQFLSKYFALHTRQFMYLPLDEARLSEKPFSDGLRIEPWTDRSFDSAARLIQLAYADHVDGQINDQYRTEAGGMKFLRNIVLLPGCGQFNPEASFLVKPATGDRLIAMLLTSTVADRVGHTTQICVMPGYQGHGIGRQLMEASIQALRRRNYESLSLTVTSVNKKAVQLYEHLGFRTIKTFAAGVWLSS